MFAMFKTICFNFLTLHKLDKAFKQDTLRGNKIAHNKYKTNSCFRFCSIVSVLLETQNICHFTTIVSLFNLFILISF